MSTVYIEPEKWGLEVVASLDTADNYEFCMLVIWRNKQGQHYLATSSGCSCPTPFEEYSHISELTRFNKHSLSEVENALKYISASYSDGIELLNKVKESFKKKK